MTAIFSFRLPGAARTGSGRLRSRPRSPRNRSRELMATEPSFSLRLQPVSQGCGQTRPSTDGMGLLSTSISNAVSKAWSSVLPVFSNAEIVFIQARISLPAGHPVRHGACFTTCWGRADETAPPLPPRLTIFIGFALSDFLSRAILSEPRGQRYAPVGCDSYLTPNRFAYLP